MANFCGDCGNRIATDDNFCTACGATLGAAAKSEKNSKKKHTATQARQAAVSFNQAIILAFQKYVDFKSRSSRSEYWYFLLFQITIYAVILLFYALLSGFYTSNVLNTGVYDVMNGLVTILLIGFWLAVLVPTLSLTTRRIHDVGYSAWALMFYLVPYLGGLIMLAFLVNRSEEDENKYGPVPNVDGQQ